MSKAKGRRPLVVDTNVAVVANRTHGESLACASASAEALAGIRKTGLLVLDDADRILAEYRRHLSLSGQPGVGDAFIKWTHDNAGRQDLITRVKITPRPQDPDDFEEFPNHAELAAFDRSDRKFVAVALRHPARPPVLNATDRDWWDYRQALNRAGVTIEFLCRNLFEEH